MQLYLLERDPVDGGVTIEIGEARWGLTAYNLDASDVEAVSFICLSYVWGTDREPSPFHPDFYVSNRTKPALAAVVTRRPSCKRIWVDAYCVPVEPFERNLTLQSMGYIYSHAEEVITVLSSAAHPVLEQLAVSDRLEANHLGILEKEDRVSRAWTYQEAVNSQRLFITCEAPNSAIVDGRHLLNCIGFTLSRFKGPQAVSEKKALYPNLDAFEDLVADYQISGYQERSALQVMSQMSRRRHHYPQDYFYAMMGAISTLCSSFETPDACEAFMSMCEEKGDYSFIYSAAKRDSSPTRRWRPASTLRLPPVFAWNWYGEGQPGHKEFGSLYLDNVVVLGRGPLEDRGEKFIKAKLETMAMGIELSGSPDLALATSAALECMGFKGSSQGISTMHGFFFPYERIWTDEDVTLLVATGVEWSFGSPGLIQPGGDIETYIPGVFFGRVYPGEATSVKMI
ncbi:hypothetical protein F5Y10DRAFT_207848 [Nemania abortiva]|nr:hypothetical protein F5Y10DRAFT_207848 [Nemania abortiva]